MAQIDRTGLVSFGDASLHVLEDPDCRVFLDWENKFKKDVFLRIVQQLNRLGWSCVVPEEMIDKYGLNFARKHRYCIKGDLQADLEVSGRVIKIEMFQNVNAPDRPDHGGRYQSEKEKHMPYLMRLEMERTRRRIRNYLCNVFSGYEFKPSKKRIPQITATELAHQYRADSGHYVKELDRARISSPGYQDKAADGGQLENGVRVWGFDYKGRAISGIAYYSLNGNWQVVSGKHSLSHHWHNTLYTAPPENIRVKRNSDLRRRRLEFELSKAIKVMNFERAAVLRNIAFPKGDLFVVWHKEHRLYHRPGFQGYTANIIDAGKFTASEVSSWGDDGLNEVRRIEAG